MRTASAEPNIDAGIGRKVGGPVHRFFTKMRVEVPSKTQELGFKFEEDRLFLMQLHPGGDSTPIWIKDDRHKEYYSRQFPTEWERYEKGLNNQISGIPLRDWKRLSETQVGNFERMNVFSVEQLAALPDATLQRFGMGGVELRKEAAAFLKIEQERQAAQGFMSTIADLQAQIEELKRGREDTSEPVESEVDRPKRGRPRKQVVEHSESPSV